MTNNNDEYWSKFFLTFIMTFLLNFSHIVFIILAKGSFITTYMIIAIISIDISFIIIAIVYYFVYKNLDN